jgi:hypothetical protein
MKSGGSYQLMADKIILLILPSLKDPHPFPGNRFLKSGNSLPLKIYSLSPMI